jgi:sterol 3beta-glucosyltransferase
MTREETLTADKRPLWPSAHLRSFRRKPAYRFAVLDWGTRGDIQPYLALGAELTRRGHSVVIAARLPYRRLIEGEGLEFFEMEEDGTEGLMRSLAECASLPDMLRTSTSYSRRITVAQSRSFWEASRGADAVLAKVITTAPALHIAEGRGVPIFLTHFDPGFIPTREYCFTDRRIVDRGPRFNRFMAGFLLASFGLFLADKINAWRRERGMRADPLGMRIWSGHLSRFPALAAWSAHFLPRPADWPANVVQTGWWILRRTAPVDRRLQDFVEAGPPPVYIGFGSWGVHAKTEVTDTLLAALRMTENRAVLLGNTVDDRKDMPPSVFVADDLPHDWLLPRAKAAVHHGGAGTVGAVITAGIPSIVVPSFDMQTAWGHRIAEKGIGLALDKRELDAGRLAAALREVETPGFRERARALGEAARSEGGAAQAADEIERRLAEAGERASIRIVAAPPMERMARALRRKAAKADIPDAPEREKAPAAGPMPSDPVERR